MKENSYVKKILLGVGTYPELFKSDRRNWFEPNCLPDTGCAVIVDSVRQSSVRLLTARLLRVLPIFNAN